jgi:uncharacterized protein YcfL
LTWTLTTAGVVAGVIASSTSTVNITQSQLELGTVANPYVATGATVASSSYGPYWLDFDGVDDRMQLSAVPFQLQDDPFVVIGLQCLSTATERDAFAVGSAGSARFKSYVNQTTGTIAHSQVDDAAVGKFLTAAGGKLGVKLVHAGRKSGTTGTAYVNAAVAQTATAAIGDSTNTSAYIGVNHAGTAFFWNGPIYSIALGKGAITDAEFLTIERYIGQKSEVTI